MRSRTILILATVAAVLPAPAAAILTVGGEILVPAYTTGAQTAPAVAIAGDGTFVVVWASDSPSESKRVRGRRFSSLGTALTPELQVASYTSGIQTAPRVAANADGTFVVAWESALGDGSGDAVRARTFTAGGVPTSAELAVNSFTTNSQRTTDVDIALDGSFIVVWHSYAQDGQAGGIFGRGFSSSGSAATAEFAVNTWTTQHQDEPVVAVRRNGTFHVAWSSFSQDGSSLGIQARRFAADGAPLGGEFAVNTFTTGIQEAPAISDGGAAGVVVSWASQSSSDDIRARRFETDGDPETGEIPVNIWTTGNQIKSAVAANADGSFVVAWQNFGAFEWEVWAREFAADGAPLGGELLVNTYLTNEQTQPELSMLPGGDLAIAWASLDQDGSQSGVYARRLRTDRIWADDFPSPSVGSFWTVVNPDGDLAITAPAGLAGTPYGMRVVLDDTTPVYLQNDLPRGEQHYRARFYLDPNGFTVGQDGERVKILQLFASSPVQRRLLTLVLRRQGGQYQLLAKFHQANDTWVNTGFHAITDAPHYVELDLSLLATGELRMWIDGTEVAELFSLVFNGGGFVDFARWGVISVKPGAAGTLYFDLFESRRQSYIGPDS